MCALHIGISSGTASKKWIVNAIVFQRNASHLLSEGMVKANLWLGNSPFAALSSGGWKFSRACSESASSFILPQAGSTEQRCAQASLLPPRCFSSAPSLASSPLGSLLVLFRLMFVYLPGSVASPPTLFQSHSLFQQTVTYMPTEMVTPGAL